VRPSRKSEKAIRPSPYDESTPPNFSKSILVESFKLYVSFAKEPYKTDDILHKRPIIKFLKVSVMTMLQSKLSGGLIM